MNSIRSIPTYTPCDRSLTLALPYIFGAIGENTLHIFGAVNLLSIPISRIPHHLLACCDLRELTNIRIIVWAFYPESSQRTLEEIDMLFTSKSPFVWEAESNFAKLMAENPNFGAARTRNSIFEDAEKAWDAKAEHDETVSSY